MANPWGDDNTRRNVAITAAFSTGLAPCLCCVGVFGLEPITNGHGVPPWAVFFVAFFVWVMPPLAALIINLELNRRRKRRKSVGPSFPPPPGRRT